MCNHIEALATEKFVRVAAIEVVVVSVASLLYSLRFWELSPRTFCSFRRELSSLRRDGLTSADARKMSSRS
jgi:hypothetical protein